MRKRWKQIGKKGLVFTLVFASLTSNLMHIRASGVEVEQVESELVDTLGFDMEDSLPSGLEIVSIEYLEEDDQYNWEDILDFTEFDDEAETEIDLTEFEDETEPGPTDLEEADETEETEYPKETEIPEEEVLETEEPDNDLSFECMDDVCYWLEDMNEHDEYKIAMIQEDEDVTYLSLETFQAAHPRLARSSFEENIVGSITVPEGMTWNTNNFNRVGNIVVSSGSHLIIPQLLTKMEAQPQ